MGENVWNREDAKNASDTTARDLDEVAAAGVDNAFKVHRSLGPGRLECVDQSCLAHEPNRVGFEVRWEVPLPIRCGEVRIATVNRLLPIRAAQVLAYPKLSDRRLRFLLDPRLKLMKNGIERLVYENCFAGFASLRSDTSAPKVSGDAPEPCPWFPVPTPAAGSVGSDIR